MTIFIIKDCGLFSDVEIRGSDSSLFSAPNTLLQMTFPVLRGHVFDTVILADTSKLEIHSVLEVAKNG